MDRSLQGVLSKIESAGAPLVCATDIFQGIVTGANQATERSIEEYSLKVSVGDGIFVLTSREVEALRLSNYESSFIKPWFKNSDIDRWLTARRTEKSLIYTRADAQLRKSDIPNLIRHFRKFKSLLVNRNVRTGSITVAEYDEFVMGQRDVPYVMIKSAFRAGNYYCISYAREESVFLGEKIICPQFSPRNTFAFDDREWFAASDVYFIKKMRGSAIDLKYLLGILNSKLCYLWLYHKGQRKGEALQLFKGPLSEIPIATGTDNQQNLIRDVTERILKEKRRSIDADTTLLEQEINRHVYDLYGLTAEEIAFVEDKVKI